MANVPHISNSSSDGQEDEIKQIKEKYGSQCRVIHDVGDFTNVVIIRPVSMDIVIKFQLTASYPGEKAAVIVRSETIAVDSMPEIMDLVNKTIKENPNTTIMDQIIEKIIHHIRELGLDNPPEVVSQSKTKHKGKSNRKISKKERQNQKLEEESRLDKKKPSMKTAEDVINRIMWDESLPSESFYVGYLDRFKGVMERAFSAFSWEDLASVDYDVLAIPKHRIQYFKYKDVIIWDKNKRVDDVFGSVGKGINVHDIMENYDLYHSVQKEQAEKNTQKPNSVPIDEDSDDDDDIEIDFGYPSNSGVDEASNWQDKLRPNHFFCVRITNEEILEGVEAMQDAILEKEPRYASCCIRPGALHLTLCTVGLDTDEQKQRACQILEAARPKFVDLAKRSIELRVEGVDNFFDRVVYAKIHHDINFTEFVDHFRILMIEGGIDIRDNYGYVPHVTIMKTTRPVSRELNTPKVKPNLYDYFSDMYFGKQIVDGIYLCEMSDQRRKDGFYVTHASINVQE